MAERYPPMKTGGDITRHYSRLRSAPHVDWQNVSPVLLNLVDNIMSHAGRVATITSGYRDPAYNRRISGATDSRHVKQVAIDANVAGVPVARSVPPSIWNRYGIRTGDQPGFFRGARDPIHVDVSPDTQWGSELVTDIIEESEEERVDPEAVLAVASVEGGFMGRVGDAGTSFGPFQLHVGGAMPAGKGGSWANHPAGVEYALDRIGDVAAGQRGEQAIATIVRRFERPQDPEAEIGRANERYRAMKASGNGRDPNKWISVTTQAGIPIPWRPHIPGLPGFPDEFPDIVPDVNNPFGFLAGPFKAIGRFFSVVIWPFTHPKRFGQILAGAILIIIGLNMMVRGSQSFKDATAMIGMAATRGAGKVAS